MKKIGLIVLLTALLPALVRGQQASPDLILLHGKVFTSDAARPTVEAVAIRGERIVAVGSSAEVGKLAGKETRVLDLQGRVVIPGINDAHVHHTPDPEAFELPLQPREPSWSEVQTALSAAVKQVPKGKWIFGTIGYGVISDPEATRAALDRIAPDHPVLLRVYYGHGFLAGSEALAPLGIADSEPDPMGGFFERVAGSDRINGKFFEYAQWSPTQRLASLVSDDAALQGMRALGAEAARYGITSLQVMSFLPVERFVRLLGTASLPQRIRVIPFPVTDTKGRDQKEGRGGPRNPHPLITVSGRKWILDGTPWERGAALRGPYHDRAGWSGTLNFPETEIASMVRESLQLNEQLLVHCAGDKPVEALFNAMEAAGPGIDWKAKRFRIEHGDRVIDDLIPRAARLGAIVVQNPAHLMDPAMINSRFGPDGKAQPLRSLIEAGVPFALGSDGPLNPYLNIMFATLHPSRPAEAMTREQAVEAYTKGSAYAEFAEQDKGSLTLGRLADLAVLSQDIFTVPVPELPKTESVLTLVGGRVVYDAGILKGTNAR